MQLSVTSLRSFVLDQLFPPMCGSCGTRGDFLCRRCAASLASADSPPGPPRCQRCWTFSNHEVCADCYSSPLDGARAPYIYDGAAQRMIQGLKYRSLHALAGPLGELLAVYAA